MTRVLIIDDEKSMRETLQLFLSEAGYEVETAEDGAVARELAAMKPFDVVIADRAMPRSDGMTLMNEIRAKTPDIQVIMMTGEPPTETAVATARAGAFVPLVKPFSKEVLLRTVANAAEVKNLRAERRRLAESTRLAETNRLYQKQLEHLVEKGALALQNAMNELEKAQRLILQQERLKALGQMASGIAHDFNNVMMPIIGLPALLLGTIGKSNRVFERLGTLPTRACTTWRAFARRAWAAFAAVPGC